MKFLLSDGSELITAQDIHVDSGTIQRMEIKICQTCERTAIEWDTYARSFNVVCDKNFRIDGVRR